MFFCQPFLELHNQHETVPDSLSEANIAPTSAQPIKSKIHCQIRHQPYQCNSKHFTMTSVWTITDWQHIKKHVPKQRRLLFLGHVQTRHLDRVTGHSSSKDFMPVWGDCKVKSSRVLFIQLWCLTVWFIRIYKRSNGVTTHPPRMADRVNCNRLPTAASSKSVQRGGSRQGTGTCVDLCHCAFAD